MSTNLNVLARMDIDISMLVVSECLHECISQRKKADYPVTEIYLVMSIGHII